MVGNAISLIHERKTIARNKFDLFGEKFTTKMQLFYKKIRLMDYADIRVLKGFD